MEITKQQAIRYSRQILLSNFDLEKQEKLMSSSALVIGVGGLGCAAAQYLVAAGIGSVTLVDDDKVELTNLQRQVLHTEKSIGINKAVSARLSLSNINSEVDIKIEESRLTHEQLQLAVSKNDIVLDCSDNLQTRNQTNLACVRQGIPLVSAAAIRMEGQIFCMDSRQNSPCYRCLSVLFQEQSLSCVEAGIMSPIVGIVGASQALEAIKVLTKFGQLSYGKLMMYDGMMSTWQVFNVPKVNSCVDCQAR